MFSSVQRPTTEIIYSSWPELRLMEIQWENDKGQMRTKLVSKTISVCLSVSTEIKEFLADNKQTTHLNAK